MDKDERYEYLKEILDEKQLKLVEKRIANLAGETKESLKEKYEFLKSKGIIITKSNELTVLSNTIKELQTRVSLLEDVSELDLYRQDPCKINFRSLENAIPLYNRINYCKIHNIPYKNSEGKYEAFLTGNDIEWNNIVLGNKEEKKVIKEEAPIVLEPVKSEVKEEPLEEVDKFTFDDYKFLDIDEYNKREEENKPVETSFSDIEKNVDSNIQDIIDKQNEARKSKEELIDFRTALENMVSDDFDDSISFDELDLDDNEVRRVA